MKIIVGQDRFGYYVEQILAGNSRKILEYGIESRKRAWTIAGEWGEYYAKLGRDVRIADTTCQGT